MFSIDVVFVILFCLKLGTCVGAKQTLYSEDAGHVVFILKDGKIICQGSIIGKSDVLTARTCANESSTDLFVRAGSVSPITGGRLHDVIKSDSNVHKINPQLYVLKVKPAFEQNNKTIKIIKPGSIDFSNHHVYENQSYVYLPVIYNEKSKKKACLEKENHEIVDITICENNCNTKNLNSTEYICAKPRKKTKHDLCIPGVSLVLEENLKFPTNETLIGLGVENCNKFYRLFVNYPQFLVKYERWKDVIERPIH